jgi:DNA-binding beta-propeller fold protein YncE
MILGGIMVIAIGGWLVFGRNTGVPVGGEPTPTPLEITRKINALDIPGGVKDLFYDEEGKAIIALAGGESPMVFLGEENFSISTQVKLVDGNQKNLVVNRVFTQPGLRDFYLLTADGRLVKISRNNFQFQGEIKLGGYLNDLTGDRDNKYLLVTNSNKRVVHVVSLDSFTLVKSVSIGGSPGQVAVEDSGSFVYVSDQKAGYVSVVSLDSFSVVASFQAGGIVSRFYPYPQSNFLLILLADANQMVALDEETNEIIKKIDVVPSPSDIAFDLTGNKAYIASYDGNAVGVLSLNEGKMTEVIKLGSSFESIVGLNQVITNEKRNRLYLSNIETGQIYQIVLN